MPRVLRLHDIIALGWVRVTCEGPTSHKMIAANSGILSDPKIFSIIELSPLPVVIVIRSIMWI